jgi:cyclohexyl-isocyanide hydratase
MDSMSEAKNGSELVIGFVLFPGFTGLDLVGPHEVLVRSAARCLLVARTLEPVQSNHGLRVLPDLAFAGCPPLDVLVVPGGPGQAQAMGDEELVGFIARQSAGAAWTASVCTGALLLARAGVLARRAATTHWLAMKELAVWGALPVPERVVRDGRVITAAGVSAGIDMALSLISDLYGPESAQEIQLAIEYDPEPPFDAGSPEKAPQSIVDRLRSTSRFSQS